MSKVIKSIGLFPYTQFFRINGQSKVNHTCGGVMSIIVYMVMAVILIAKLVQAFKMQTITFITQTQVSLEPPQTVLSTLANDTNNAFYMLAFSVNPAYSCSTGSISYSAYTLTGTGDITNRTNNFQNFPMESCSPAHFPMLPGIQEKYKQWGINNWLCLPLNNTYQIGGSYVLSTLYNSLYFQFYCNKTCGLISCADIDVYQLSAQVNPSNSTQPLSYYLSRNSIQLNNVSYYEYEFNLDESILTTDNSLLPTQSLSTLNSVTTGQTIIGEYVVDPTSTAFTRLYIQRSGITTMVNRNYLKLLDVLSYVGGIFPSILAIFFFMGLFGIYFFELTFAYRYYRCFEAKHKTFLSYIKSVCYAVLLTIGYPPNWQLVKRQNKIQQVVNKTLDFALLFKRIEYLERAITVLFEKHQLKGLHLFHTLSIDDAEKNFNKYKFRDKLIHFLNKNKSEQVQEIKQKQKKERQKISPGMNNNPSSNNQQIKKVKNEQREKDCLPSVQEFVKHLQSEEKIVSSSSMKMISSREKYGLNQSSKVKKRSENQILLKREAELINPMEQQELSQFQQQIMTQLEADLKKLFDEAKGQDGDERSKRIIENIDGWLREQLEGAIEEQKKSKFHFSLHALSS